MYNVRGIDRLIDRYGSKVSYFGREYPCIFAQAKNAVYILICKASAFGNISMFDVVSHNGDNYLVKSIKSVDVGGKLIYKSMELMQINALLEVAFLGEYLPIMITGVRREKDKVQHLVETVTHGIYQGGNGKRPARIVLSGTASSEDREYISEYLDDVYDNGGAGELEITGFTAINASFADYVIVQELGKEDKYELVFYEEMEA